MPTPVFLSIIFVLVASLWGDERTKALTLAHEAGQVFESDPARSSQLAEQAFAILSESQKPAPADLGACAGLVARAARLAGDTKRAQTWFEKALTFAAPDESATVRAELADMLMRDGDLPAARTTLGPVPNLKPPSATLAQWFQTSAKLHLACGLPAKAEHAIQSAISALPEDDIENRVALAIDAAGIALRLEKPVTDLIENARLLLRTLPQPDPQLLSALTSIAAQAPDLSDDAALALLQSIKLDSLPPDARLSYSVNLAEAALRVGKKDLARQALRETIASDILPDDHPLLARALSLQATAAEDQSAAIQSSEVALRWLANSQDSNILLGLQRTVDPLSPLINHAPDKLPLTALKAQNFALRNRLNGQVVLPDQQTVVYLIYQKNFARHYGALLFQPKPAPPKWFDLGPAEKIHQRISDTLETAERTLAENTTGATLPVRLTQLWKSLWAPLADSLNPNQPINISPVGMLHAVPWATLRQRDGRYLCEVLDDVRLLALTGQFPPQKPSEKMIICGINSAPGPLAASGEFPFDQQLSQLVAGLPALPGVTSEISKLRGRAVTNPNRNEFVRLLQQNAGTLHLAGHGFVIESEEGHGFRAGLILHGGGAGNIIFANEIANLNLHRTNLIVLSACRGGIGQGEVGGNWSSLRRSFIAAGARQVLAAQWRVRDDQLSSFMKAFHEARESEPAHLALWKLQRQWISGGNDIDLASAGAWVLEGIR